MAVTVTHTRVATIPADPVTEARGGVTTAHWNDDHTIVGIDTIESNIRDLAFVDMNNADYTMTNAEATAAFLVLTNVGDGTKTLTWPTSSDTTRAASQVVATLFASNYVTAAAESGGATASLAPGTIHIVSVPDGLGAFNIDQYIQNECRRSSNGIYTLPAGNTDASDGDGGMLIKASDAVAQTYTIQAGLLFNNLTIYFYCDGAGGLTIQGGVGVTVTGNTVLASGGSCKLWRDLLTETYICV